MDRRADAHELLDGPLHDHDAVVANLRDLRRLNRLFGGVALSRWGVNRLLDGAAGTASVLDVGTGGADIPVALLADARRHGRDLTVTAVDHRPEIVAAARSARPSLDHVAGLRLDVAEGTALPYPDASFDVAHASLVIHHLDADEAVRFLAELRRVSRRGVVVNDVDRGRFAWTVTWLMTRLLARGRFTRHDAPASIRRAYTAVELEGLLRQAGLVPAATRTMLGHRYAVVAVPSDDRG